MLPRYRSSTRRCLLIGGALLGLATLLVYFANPHVRPSPIVMAHQTLEKESVIVNITTTASNQDNRLWKRTSELAEKCIKLHSLGADGWHKLNETTLHIVYFAWLPENGNARHIIPKQLGEIQNSGLFDRPRTKLHVVLSTQSLAEQQWFTSLDVIQKYQRSIFISSRNTFEFAGIRYLYELGCQHSSDLFLYFHNKGARYDRGRIGMEIVLTREVVVHWKNMLTLVAEHSTFHTFGVGGPGYQWMNFFYARGSLFPLVPKPVVVPNRFWYEEWSGNDLAPTDPSISPTANSQCSTITGMEKAINEPTTSEPNLPRRTPQYGFLRCGSASVDSPQLDAWSIPAAEEAERQYSHHTQSTKPEPQ